MLIKFKLTAFALLFFMSVSAQNNNRDNSSDAAMTQLIEIYQADYGSLHRFYQIRNSPERRERFRMFFNDYLKAIDELPFDAFSVEGKADYLLFKNKLQLEISGLDEEKQEYERMRTWVEFGESLYELEKERRRGKHFDSQKVAEQLNAIGLQLKGKMNQLEKEKPVFPQNLVNRASDIIAGQQDALKSVYDFYNGYDPDFSWWITKPYEELNKLLESYAAKIEASVDASTLSKDDGSGIIGNPIGKKKLISLLQHEMIPYSPEKLVEIAMNEFKWCEKELLKASNEMGFGNDWKAAQEKVKQSYVAVGQQPEEMYKLYNESVDFLKSHDLLTIPPVAEETWRMEMLSPKRQLIAPFFLGGEVLQIAYPTSDMEQQDKLMSLRGNNPHFARAVVHHELIAGHHLQGFMNKRYRTYRNFGTPFWTEGWALYWEFVLWDEGFPRSAEDRIGMLFWRMHRCARIIFSLNYHLGEWTPQQCIDYLVDRVGHERSTAAGEVRRSFTGGYGPLYQIAYMIGGLQFYELKKELVDSGKMSYKQFHDAVLRENSMPVEMVRAILTDQPLKKNFKTSWEFYKD